MSRHCLSQLALGSIDPDNSHPNLLFIMMDNLLCLGDIFPEQTTLNSISADNNKSISLDRLKYGSANFRFLGIFQLDTLMLEEGSDDEMESTIRHFITDVHDSS